MHTQAPRTEALVTELVPTRNRVECSEFRVKGTGFRVKGLG